VKVIGLTGSIAAGKSEVSRILANHNVPVLEADDVVHEIYGDGTAGAVLKQEFGDCMRDGKVIREELSRHVLGNAERLRRLEQLIHPLVRERERQFLADQRRKMAKAAVLSIPLLLETGRQGEFDAVIVVSAPEAALRRRALSRKSMTVQKLEHILNRQMPDAQKRKLATHVIVNDGSFEELERKTLGVLNDIMAGSSKQ
jgi:dephospho-CoA kinase